MIMSLGWRERMESYKAAPKDRPGRKIGGASTELIGSEIHGRGRWMMDGWMDLIASERKET